MMQYTIRNIPKKVDQIFRKQGTPIPINDLWIAALALQHDLTLYARDAHFDHIPQLRRL